MPRVVVVLFGFHTRIRKVIDLHVQIYFPARRLHHARQFQHSKLFSELVEHAAFAGARRLQTGKLYAADRIADVQIPARLSTFSVHRQRMSHRRLRTETVEHRTEDFIVVKAVDESFIQRNFVGHGSIHHALIEIGGAQPPDLTGEHDVMAVVHLGQMIERTRLLGKRQHILAAVVLHRQKALFDIDIGRTILPHGAQFDQVAIGTELPHGEQKIERADYIIYLSKDRVLAVDHRIGSGALFRKMDHGVRRVSAHQRRHEIVVGDISGKKLDGLPGQLPPGPKSFGHRPDRRQSLHAQFIIPLAPRKVIGNYNLVSLSGKIKGRSPSAVTVSAQHTELHN